MQKQTYRNMLNLFFNVYIVQDKFPSVGKITYHNCSINLYINLSFKKLTDPKLSLYGTGQTGIVLLIFVPENFKTGTALSSGNYNFHRMCSHLFNKRNAVASIAHGHSLANTAQLTRTQKSVQKVKTIFNTQYWSYQNIVNMVKMYLKFPFLA